MKKYTLIATAPMGIEAVVAKEVRELGYECQVDNGKVILKETRSPFAARIYGFGPQTV